MAYGLSNGHMTDDLTWPWKVKLVTPIHLKSAISRKLLELETSNLVCSFVSGMPSGEASAQIMFPENGRGLGHVTLQFLAVRLAILATAWLLVLFRHGISELRPIAVKLCRVISTRADFIKQVQKLLGPPLQNFGGQNVQNLGRFLL